MKPSSVPLFLCQMLPLFQSEEDTKSENDEADDMPEVQDTVQFIPGSKLLWRINCRPPNSSQVTLQSACALLSVVPSPGEHEEWSREPCCSVTPRHRTGSGSSCCPEITLQQALLQSCAESSPAVPELAQGMHAPSAAGDLGT